MSTILKSALKHSGCVSSLDQKEKKVTFAELVSIFCSPSLTIILISSCPILKPPPHRGYRETPPITNYFFEPEQITSMSTPGISPSDSYCLSLFVYKPREVHPPMQIKRSRRPNLMPIKEVSEVRCLKEFRRAHRHRKCGRKCGKRKGNPKSSLPPTITENPYLEQVLEIEAPREIEAWRRSMFFNLRSPGCEEPMVSITNVMYTVFSDEDFVTAGHETKSENDGHPRITDTENKMSKLELKGNSSSSTLVSPYGLAKAALSKFSMCSSKNSSSARVSMMGEESTGDPSPDTEKHALSRISYKLRVQIKSTLKNLKRMHQAMQHIFSDS